MASLKWTKEKIINFVNNDDNCIFVDFIKFNGMASRIVFYCKIHKIQCEITFNNFKSGQRCKECSKERRREGLIKWTKDKINKYIKDNSNYQLLNIEIYNGLCSIIKLKCDHQHIYTQNFHDFKDGKRCPHCSRNAKLNIDIIKNKIEEEGYILLSTEYKNAQSDLKVECDKGHIYTTNWNRFQNGKRCPHCSITKGEKKIRDFLDDKLIEYIYDRPYFKDLKSDKGKVLKPDFIIPDKKIWIEFDGIQHFEPTDFAGKGKEWAEKQLRTNQENDKIKNEYAKEHNWKLIRIPYWEIDNIEIMLNKLL